MPAIRDYPQATSLVSTDAFVIDRLTTGTMFIEALNLSSTQRIVTYIIDNSGTVLNTGVAGDLWIGYACAIDKVTLLADQTGSVVVDIWNASYAAYPPTVANTIVAAHPPTITAATSSQDATLTGWTTALAANSTLRFNVNSVSSITRLTVALLIHTTP